MAKNNTYTNVCFTDIYIDYSLFENKLKKDKIQLALSLKTLIIKIK